MDRERRLTLLVMPMPNSSKFLSVRFERKKLNLNACEREHLLSILRIRPYARRELSPELSQEKLQDFLTYISWLLERSNPSRLGYLIRWPVFHHILLVLRDHS
jgi:hypothetical protein